MNWSRYLMGFAALPFCLLGLLLAIFAVLAVLP